MAKEKLHKSKNFCTAPKACGRLEDEAHFNAFCI